MEKLGEEIIKEAYAYKEKALESFLPESTKTLGRIILLISVFLILLFSNTIKITEGEFFGAKIDLNQSNRTILFIVVLVVLVFFAIQYLFDYFHYIHKWREKNSINNLKVVELINQLQSIDQENAMELMNALKSIKNDMGKFVKRKAQINQIDEAVSLYLEHCYKKIKWNFNFRKTAELIPIFILLLAIIFAFKFYFNI